MVGVDRFAVRVRHVDRPAGRRSAGLEQVLAAARATASRGWKRLPVASALARHCRSRLPFVSARSSDVSPRPPPAAGVATILYAGRAAGPCAGGSRTCFLLRAENSLLDKAIAGRRLECRRRARAAPDRTIWQRLGRAADTVTRQPPPEPFRTYNVDRNINYTNICTSGCRFCAFSRKLGDRTLTSFEPRSCTGRSRRPSPWAATKFCCRAACTRS